MFHVEIYKHINIKYNKYKYINKHREDPMWRSTSDGEFKVKIFRFILKQAAR